MVWSIRSSTGFVFSFNIQDNDMRFQLMCLSGRREQWRGQDTTRSVSDRNNARVSILTPQYGACINSENEEIRRESRQKYSLLISVPIGDLQCERTRNPLEIYGSAQNIQLFRYVQGLLHGKLRLLTVSFQKNPLRFMFSISPPGCSG